ncbi:hypothetical protein BU23DRAFT_654557 [Bimuria novae-zelandiae CBS 107.79]|uniref:BTB domain-containing protein n=1 Tax=Bimuria novae-zelandiae CBS 107.79 TaxID=1447943 RepID=A0A6A5VLF2_9PLEO|nr:hypothetical protein BU23DRAFT_654557 [Bimuria novae-zelandiae CBS 107.79]
MARRTKHEPSDYESDDSLAQAATMRYYENLSSNKRQRLTNNYAIRLASDDDVLPELKHEKQDSLVANLNDNDLITLDDMYDLTLIVGAQGALKGVKAFRVSSACLRMAGNVFKTSKSEMSLPDDSPDAFLIILRIVHWQHHEMPNALNKDQLLDLAIACGKYSLYDIIKAILHLKDWLASHKKGGYMPVDTDIQNWILIAYNFKFDQDYQYLTNSLAMNLQSI